jgi:hydrogenase maturation protease
VIIDALQSGQHPPGSILELNPSDLRPVKTPSPHYAGLPEMLAMARQYQWQFPEEIRIFAVEVEDALTIREGLSPSIRNAIPELVKRVMAQVDAWRN